MNELRLEHASALSVLHELFASATHDASAAMCRWTNGLISVALDEVREVNLVDLSSELGIGDEMLTMVVLSLEGEVGGNMILVFDETDGRQLAASLLDMQPDIFSEWSDLEKSALSETGNILGCAYVNAISRLIGCDLAPTAPYFIQDFGASVLQQAVMTQALTSDTLLLCEIRFHRADEELDWRVVFVPTQGMKVAMQRSLHTSS